MFKFVGKRFALIDRYGAWPDWVWKAVGEAEGYTIELVRGVVASYVGDHRNYGALMKNLEQLRDDHMAGRGWKRKDRRHEST